jgi:hypothetical protein
MKIIKVAKSYLGVIEGSSRHHAIIDYYNTNIKPLPQGYKVKYNDSWCATFASVCMKEAKVIKAPYECSVPRMWERAKKNGQTTKKPKVGYLIIYDWNNNGSLDHVGIVEKVNGNNLTVIEGNYCDSVKRRKISALSDCIHGYIKVKEGE